MCFALLFLPLLAVPSLLAGLVLFSRQEALLAAASEALAAAGAALGDSMGEAHPLLWLAAGAGWVSVVVTTLAVAAAAWLYAAYLFCTADADLGLLLRGRHRENAFAGKVVWVTGASQGLGAQLAKYIARHGGKLILSARSVDGLNQTKATCRQPRDVLILPFDLLDTDDKLAAAARSADEAFGGAGVDYLVHMAGASQHALAAETTGQVADKLLQLNTLAPIRLTQAVLPHMIKRRKGRLVVVASMAAKVPSPGQAVYSGAKAALWGYFSSVAAELADQGVSVTLVCPGPVAAAHGDSSTRSLYGPTGPIQRHEVQDSRRMPAFRAAVLIATAMAAGVGECWLAKQPVLLLAYLMQYAPALGMFILKRVGPKRARALASGKSGYDVGALLRGASS